MTDTPATHHRRSIRLRGYDYAQAGAYFITICTHNRECLFGEIADGEMRLRPFGRIVTEQWNDIPSRFPVVEPDAFTVMPNSISQLTEEKAGKGVRNGKERFKENVVKLQKVFSLSVPHPKAYEIRDDLALFQAAIKARFAKFDEQGKTRTGEEIETAIRQIVNDAIISREVIDVFNAAGIRKPDISILSDEFLSEIHGMEKKPCP